RRAARWIAGRFRGLRTGSRTARTGERRMVWRERLRSCGAIFWGSVGLVWGTIFLPWVVIRFWRRDWRRDWRFLLGLMLGSGRFLRIRPWGRWLVGLKVCGAAGYRLRP